MTETSETVAIGCDQLPATLHGKEGVDGSSPSEGFSEATPPRRAVPMEADSELPLARVFRPASAQARLADLEWPALASRGGAHATDASRRHRRVGRRGATARPLG